METGTIGTGPVDRPNVSGAHTGSRHRCDRTDPASQKGPISHFRSNQTGRASIKRVFSALSIGACLDP